MEDVQQWSNPEKGNLLLYVYTVFNSGCSEGAEDLMFLILSEYIWGKTVKQLFHKVSEDTYHRVHF